MKIFGLGLSRTGTKSLTLALNQLGFKIAHYPRDEETLRDLMTGNYNFHALRDHDGMTDITVSPYFAQLDRLFPGSKFILTTRDKEAWLKSMEAFFAKQLAPNKRPNEIVVKLRLFTRVATYGSFEFSRDRFSYVWDMHLKNVREYFRDRPEALLEMNITAGEGWEKLCAFLGKPVPDAPFPSIKNSADVRKSS